MYSIHATRKLLDRVDQPIHDPVAKPGTFFGNWYATVLFWQPQVVLLVNERTLLPVAMPLAPARTLMTRFPEALGPVLEAVGVPLDLAIQEVAAMSDGTYAKTANRSVVGAMTEFAFLAETHRGRRGTPDLLELSIRLAGTPCGPLNKSHDFPDQEVQALVAENWPTPGGTI